MEPQIFPDQDYAPGTPVSWVVTVPVEYDMTGKTITFELAKGADVIFRLTDASPEIVISGQTITLVIPPDTESEDALGNTFGEAMAMACRKPGSERRFVPFNCSIQATGSTSVDIRWQGDFLIYPDHGQHGS